ncbi:CTL-like protein 2, partial [Asbolus verrucosus]
QPIPYDPDFNGPLKNRSCTDVICLLLFLVFIGCWVGVAIYAFTNGDPKTLLAPKDSYGSKCGIDYHVRDKPYLFFFDLTKCLSPTVPFTGCPTRQICVERCPSSYFVYKGNAGDYNQVAYCDYNTNKPTSNSEAETLFNQEKCAKWHLPSSPLLYRCIYNIADRKSLKGDIVESRCIPKINSTFFESIKGDIHFSENELISSIKNIKALSQAEQVGQNVVDDLISSWLQILIGIAIAVVACIIYIVIMRWIAAVMVWLSLIGVVVLLSVAVYFTATKYVDLKNNPKQDDANNNVFESYMTKKDTWLTLLIIASILLGIILLMIIFLRKRILLAIALVKEGSKAVSSVTAVLFFPIFPWILQVGVIAFSICVALYLATTGDPLYEMRGMSETCPCWSQYKDNLKCAPDTFTENCWDAQTCKNATCKFITMNNPSLYPYLQAFNVFGFFWGTFFVSAMGQMILASVFATWYWTFRKSNLPFFAVLEATFRTLRYHIGTLAFGSLIITICRIIRVMLEYVDHKLRKYDNEITKAILCCCKCFFWCLEKFLKFINRNAYIMCAIHGKNFCTSAKDAFLLLMRNIIRVFVLDKVTDFLFFMGKLLITIGVGAIAYVFFATDLTGFDNSGLNYNVVPIIVIMICTYFIATIFFNVYSMAVDTLFLCFLEDCERNDGSQEKPYYMSKNLMKIFGKKNKRD